MQLKDSTGKVIAEVEAADPNVAGCDEGIWLTINADDKTKPTLCLIKDKSNGPFKGGWYLGVYRDVKSSPLACDLAISFSKETGPVLQVTKGKEVKFIDLFDLAK